MAWYNEKFECPNPPDCAANQMVPPSEWNAMVAYLKDKIRGMPFTAPGAGDDGKYIKYVHGTPGFILETPAGGGTTWLTLTDTPSSFSGQAGKYPKVNAGETALEFSIPAGAGDVVGPASSVNNRIVLFDGVTGKLIKDSGILGADIFERDGSVAMIGDASFNAYNIGWKFGAQINSPKLFSMSGSPYELFCKPSGGNSIGEFGIMPSGTNEESALIVWNSNDYDNGGYAFFRISSLNKLIIDPGQHGTGIAPTVLEIGFDTLPYEVNLKLGNSTHYWHSLYASNLYFEGSQGDILFVNSAGKTVKLSPGTSGHFLKTQGASADPIWAAGAGGVNTWLELTDTPGAFDNGKIVKSGAAALSFGMLESDIFKKDGSVAMTGNLDMGSYTIFGPELNPSGDSSDLKIEGGDGAWNTQIRLYGKNHLSMAGLISFGVPNAAKSALLTVLQIDGVSDNPIINWYYPIKVDAINEKTVNAGVTIDTCLIKDGKAADTLKIKGKTVDDAAIGDDKILVYKTTGDKLVYETKPTGGGQEIVAATLIVAANDSKDKNRADYECGGANDHIQIQQALDALTGVGGRVVLLEGNYSGTVNLDIESKQALVGQGPSTRLSGMDIEIEANASEILIADMYINGNIDFKTHEIKDSIFRHLSGLDFACENMASTSEGNLFDGVRAKQFKINGKHNRFSDCYAHIPSGTGICFNLLSTATKNWLSNCHAYNGYDEDYMISGKENLLTDCTSKDNRYISIWLASGADRNIISGGMIDGGNVTAAAYNSLIRIQSDDNKIEGMYIIVRDTDTDYGIKIESTADKTMITDIRFKNEGVGTPSEFSDAGSDTRKRDNVGFNGAWVTDT